MKRQSVAAAVVVLLVITLDSSMAQVDLSRLLVGTWEGDISSRSWQQSRRVLVIKGLHEQDGKWIVDAAEYGRPGGYMDRVAIVLKTRGEKVNLQFGRPASEGQFSLEFVKEDLLTGTVLTHLGGYSTTTFTKIK